MYKNDNNGIILDFGKYTLESLLVFTGWVKMDLLPKIITSTGNMLSITTLYLQLKPNISLTAE